MPVITFIEFDGTKHQIDSESGLTVMEMAMKHAIFRHPKKSLILPKKSNLQK